MHRSPSQQLQNLSLLCVHAMGVGGENTFYLIQALVRSLVIALHPLQGAVILLQALQAHRHLPLELMAQEEVSASDQGYWASCIMLMSHYLSLTHKLQTILNSCTRHSVHLCEANQTGILMLDQPLNPIIACSVCEGVGSHGGRGMAAARAIVMDQACGQSCSTIAPVGTSEGLPCCLERDVAGVVGAQSSSRDGRCCAYNCQLNMPSRFRTFTLGVTRTCTHTLHIHAHAFTNHHLSARCRRR